MANQTRGDEPEHPTDARQLVADVSDIQRRTRAGVGGVWFPLLLFGVLMVTGTALAATGDVPPWIFWSIAAPAGSAATAVFFIRRQRRRGVQRPPAPWLATAVLIVVGVFATAAAANALGWPRLAVAGPALAISLGYALFARLTSHRPTGLLAGVLAALTVALLLTNTTVDTLRQVVGYAYGASFIVLGLVSAGFERRAARS